VVLYESVCFFTLCLHRLQRHIVVFSHWAVLRALTGKSFDNCESWECGVEELLADVLVADDD
jgi:hypothetical protein